jgi:Tat protein secretion system quality control protein TatD with DNase activity
MLSDVRRDTSPNLTGTVHCYTSNWHYAEQYLQMGFYIGFTGVITFPPQKKNPQAQEDLLEVVRRMPLDKILLETDCPYLSPLPYRGKSRGGCIRLASPKSNEPRPTVAGISPMHPQVKQASLQTSRPGSILTPQSKPTSAT